MNNPPRDTRFLKAQLHAWAVSGGRFVPHGTFRTDLEEVHDLLLWLRDTCRKLGVSVTLQDPSGTKLAVFVTGAVLVGAAVGGSLAGPLGALGGAGVGLVLGYCTAHLTLTITDGPGPHPVFSAA
jgi:hypothetical protein